MTLHRLSLVGAVVIVVAAAGCGGGGGGAKSKGASGSVVKSVAIDESEFKLAPSSVTLDKPGTYEFKAVNKGTITHALEVEGTEEKETDHIEPGQSATVKVTFDKDGKFEMYCPVDGHKDKGMEGTITVGSGGGGGATTETETTGGGY